MASSRKYGWSFSQTASVRLVGLREELGAAGVRRHVGHDEVAHVDLALPVGTREVAPLLCHLHEHDRSPCEPSQMGHATARGLVRVAVERCQLEDHRQFLQTGTFRCEVNRGYFPPAAFAISASRLSAPLFARSPGPGCRAIAPSCHSTPVPVVGGVDDGAIEVEAAVDALRAAERDQVGDEVGLGAGAHRARGDARVRPILNDGVSSEFIPLSVITSVIVSDTEIRPGSRRWRWRARRTPGRPTCRTSDPWRSGRRGRPTRRR